jgi:tetratricopeptide (TPR) repeat protein
MDSPIASSQPEGSSLAGQGPGAEFPRPLQEGDHKLRYEVAYHPFAHGSMGTIWSAWDHELGRDVAVKCMRPELTQSDEARARFYREVDVLARLNHPGVCPVYSKYMLDDPPCFTMKHLEGETLKARLSALRRAERDEASKFAERMKLLDAFHNACNAVAYAHSRGVIHRDLKPDNIMLGEYGETIVLDWGLARLNGGTERAPAANLSGRESDVRQTPATPLASSDGTVLGTPVYMPPEQAQGRIDLVDERSDVYALGAILYEILSGRRPYDDATPESVLQRVLEGRLIPLREAAPLAPQDLVTLAEKAMARDRDRRLESAEALAREIEAFRTGRGLSVYQYSSWELVKRFVQRNRLAAGVTLAAAAVLTGVLAWSIVSISTERNQAQSALADRNRIEREQEMRSAGLIHERRSYLSAKRAYLETLDPNGKAAAARGYLDQLKALSLEERRHSGPNREDVSNAVLALAAVAEVRHELIRLAMEPVDGRWVQLLEARELREHQAKLLDERLLAAQLAKANDDFALAESILLAADDGDAQIATMRENVRYARGALLDARAARILTVLREVKDGQTTDGNPITAETLLNYVTELSGYRDRQSIHLLDKALDPLVEVAKAEGSSARWNDGERSTAKLVLRTLGFLQMGDLAAPVLARFMDVIWDYDLAVECGRALCQTRSVNAHDPLVRAMMRLMPQASAWQAIAPHFKLVPDPGDDGKAEDRVMYHAWRGWAALAKDRMEAARVHLELALALDSECVLAWGGLGEWASLEEDWKVALDHFTRALELEPDLHTAIVNRGWALWKSGRTDEARIDFDRALSMRRTAYAYRLRGLYRWGTGELDGAHTDLSRSLEQEREYASAYWDRGDLRFSRGDEAGALADYTRGIELMPDAPRAFLQRGITRRLNQDYEGSIEDFSRAIGLNSKDAVAYVQRAITLLTAGRAIEALSDLEMASNLAPDNPGIYLVTRGAAKQDLGDFEGAAADYDLAIATSPSAVAYSNRGYLKMEVYQDYAGAIKDFDLAINHDPGFSLAYSNRGMARQLSGDSAGEQDYVTALQLDPRNAKAFHNRGYGRYLKGDYEGAQADFTRSIDIDSTYAPAFGMRGAAKLALSDLGGALDDFERSIELDATKASAFNNRGWVRFLSNEYEGAASDYEKALSLDDRDPMIYDNRARLRAAQGDVEGALADHDMAVRYAPEHPGILFARGLHRARMGLKDGAIEDLTRTLNLNSEHIAAYSNRGFLHFSNGDFGPAMSDFDNAIERHPQHVRALTMRSRLRLIQDDLDGAKRDAAALLEIDENCPFGQVTLGIARRKEGDTDGALEYLNRALGVAPRHAGARLERARIYLERGQVESALADATAAIQVVSDHVDAYVMRAEARLVDGDLDGALADLTDARNAKPAHYWLRLTDKDFIERRIQEVRRMREANSNK